MILFLFKFNTKKGIIHPLFPTSALPASGLMGMISARYFKAPLTKSGAKIGILFYFFTIFANK